VEVSEAGIRQLRLYFMVGLPTETMDMWRDPRLAKFLEHSVIKESLGKKHLGLITLSLSSFVPKPSPLSVDAVSGSGGAEKAPEAGGREFHGVKACGSTPTSPSGPMSSLAGRGDRG